LDSRRHAGGDLVFTDNTLTNVHPSIATGGGGVTLTAGARAATTMNIDNNDFRDSHTAALTINKSRDNAARAGSLTATVNNNDIGVAGVANSGSLEGSGISTTHFGESNFNPSPSRTTGSASTTRSGSTSPPVAASSRAGTSTSTSLATCCPTPAPTRTSPSSRAFGVNSGVAAGDTFQTFPGRKLRRATAPEGPIPRMGTTRAVEQSLGCGERPELPLLPVGGGVARKATDVRGHTRCIHHVGVLSCRS
jgi:hypothetical protein